MNEKVTNPNVKVSFLQASLSKVPDDGSKTISLEQKSEEFTF
jgi:hypothetical protein